MTSDTGHVPAEVLADAAEGLLPAAEQSAVDEHLSHCTDCRQVAVDLRDIPTLLAAAPSPPMPDDVAMRIEAALQAEPPLTASTPREAITTPARARRTRRMPVWIGAAAAAVLGVTGAVLGLRALDAPESSTSSISGAALEADRAAEAPDATLAAPPDSRDYTADTLDERVQALVRTGDADDSTAGDGREAAPGTLPGSGTSGEAAAPGQDESSLGALGTPAGLAACIEALTGRTGVTPLAVDVATYEGQPAAILVLPDPTDDAFLDVRVVGAGCSADNDDVIAATRVPRP
jgi:hypothetical protein